MGTLIAASILSLFFGGLEFQDKAAGTPSVEDRVHSILTKYEEADRAYREGMKAAQANSALRKQAEPPNPQSYTTELLALARSAPKSAAAEEALVWITSKSPTNEMDEARSILNRDFLGSAKLGPAISQQGNLWLSPDAEIFLRGVLANSPHPAVQAHAAFTLAKFLKRRASMIRSYQRVGEGGVPQAQKEAMFRNFDRAYGKGWRELLIKADPPSIDREADALFGRVTRDYGDLIHDDGNGRRAAFRDLVAEYLKRKK